MKTNILCVLCFSLSLLSVSAFIREGKGYKKEVSGNDEVMSEQLPEGLNGVGITPVDFDYFDSIDISMEKLQLTTKNGKEYRVEGYEIEEDKGFDSFAAYASLMEQMVDGEICVPPSLKVSVNFLDEIPETVTFYTNNYMNRNGGSKYPGIRQSYCFEQVGESMELTFGIDAGICLDSNFSTEKEKYYRVFRIVCKFEKKTMEYYLFCE